jgi:hypothetical protein
VKGGEIDRPSDLPCKESATFYGDARCETLFLSQRDDPGFVNRL